MKEAPTDIIEVLAELEHEQWMKWSKDIADKETLSDGRLERWRKCWVPYAELTEDMKEFDREWARKSLLIVLKEFGGP
jgi:hypothetical protein